MENENLVVNEKENEVEKAKRLLQEDYEKRVKLFHNDIMEVYKKHGFELRVEASIIPIEVRHNG